MASLQPHVRRAGEGPAVLCLHSSTSSSKQWETLIEKMSGDYQVVAPDLYGYGRSPEWDGTRALALTDEIDLLRPVLDNLCERFHLVGHSYGAAVAFKIALMFPQRVRSLVAYEPVLFNLLSAAADSPVAVDIGRMKDDVFGMVAARDLDGAARRFVDYWSGNSAYDRMSDWQRETVAKRMPKVVADFDAVMSNPSTLDDYRRLEIPTLFMYGARSPESTRLIAEWLGGVLPKAEVRGLLPLGHMGPLTHADQVYSLIDRFIRRQPSGIPAHQLRHAR